MRSGRLHLDCKLTRQTAASPLLFHFTPPAYQTNLVPFSDTLFRNIQASEFYPTGPIASTIENLGAADVQNLAHEIASYNPVSGAASFWVAYSSDADR